MVNKPTSQVPDSGPIPSIFFYDSNCISDGKLVDPPSKSSNWENAIFQHRHICHLVVILHEAMIRNPNLAVFIFGFTLHA